MLKKIFSWQDDFQNPRDVISVSSIVLAIYCAIAPISNGLSGLLGKINIVNYITIIFFLTAAIELLRNPEPFFRKDHVIVYVFFFYTVASFFWNENLIFDWGFRTVLTTILLFFFATGRKYSEKERRLFTNAIFVGIIIVLAVVAINYPSVRDGRLRVFVKNEIDPNFFGCDLCVAMALLMTKSLEKKNRWFVIPLALLFLIIFLLSSRGAMLVAFGMLLWWACIAASKKKILVPIVAVALFLCFHYIAVDFPRVFLGDNQVSDLISKRASIMSLIEDKGAGRLQIWLEAWKCFVRSSPMEKLFGHGLGSFKNAVDYIAPGHSSQYASHNVYVNTLIEGGVIGLLLMLAAFLRLFITSVKNRNLFGQLAFIGMALEGVSLDVQFSRVFALTFIIAAIYKGGDDFEIR